MYKLTREQKDRYLKCEFSRCPDCKSDRIESVEFDFDFIESNEIRQEIHCLECGISWIDIYKLTDIEIINE